MHARHLMLESPAMGRKVHLWCYGHYGPPVIVFPSAAGFAHEWDRHGMFEVLGPLIRAGKVKFYCPESNVSQVWTDKESSIAARMQRHRAYEGFILDTLVPFIREDCRWEGAPMTAVGCSLGGTYAALFALKYPETFRRVLCMSGRYLTTELTGKHNDSDLYFNNPLAFVPGLRGEPLERLRRNTHLTLVCGRGAYEEGCIEETIALGQLLKEKDIPSVTDIWGRESRHDWDWWQRQVVVHLPRLLG
ncbi:Esterase/lipase superfamily enzyme [Nannocystis exedens]|uniref:Esterase/lipase superfamily enzyme n=1 Tax=Nannocystis exedens TaxID=54 RepID=A0A1I2FJI2_9BACT|nr:alpha/beta hydrolase-fold protein [Nannocystis exedens]PCC70417.1 putative esterase [Nannocystis exedens]SFF04621.1 Esterase/lipase superfamily enzyme [Nannocystis exedens]